MTHTPNGRQNRRDIGGFLQIRNRSDARCVACRRSVAKTLSAGQVRLRVLPERLGGSGFRVWGLPLFRGGLVFKAHRLLYHSTLGLRVIKKKKKVCR